MSSNNNLTSDTQVVVNRLLLTDSNAMQAFKAYINWLAMYPNDIQGATDACRDYIDTVAEHSELKKYLQLYKDGLLVVIPYTEDDDTAPDGGGYANNSTLNNLTSDAQAGYGSPSVIIVPLLEDFILPSTIITDDQDIHIPFDLSIRHAGGLIFQVIKWEGNTGVWLNEGTAYQCVQYLKQYYKINHSKNTCIQQDYPEDFKEVEAQDALKTVIYLAVDKSG